jgi:hypothetical protein
MNKSPLGVCVCVCVCADEYELLNNDPKSPNNQLKMEKRKNLFVLGTVHHNKCKSPFYLLLLPPDKIVSFPALLTCPPFHDLRAPRIISSDTMKIF